MLRALDAEEEAEETSSNDSVLGKGKGKGGKGDGMRCGACGSLLYIPFTPGADMPKGGKGQGGQRVMYDSDEWHALQELRYREAEAKGQAKGGKSAAEILLGGLEPGPREERSRSRSPQPAWVAAVAGVAAPPSPKTPPDEYVEGCKLSFYFIFFFWFWVDFKTLFFCQKQLLLPSA